MCGDSLEPFLRVYARLVGMLGQSSCSHQPGPHVKQDVILLEYIQASQVHEPQGLHSSTKPLLALVEWLAIGFLGPQDQV